MKVSILYSLAPILAIVEAATLNVGSGKTYTTIAAAYNAASAGDTIYVYPGTYKEKLTISKDSITIKGSAYPATNPSSNLALVTYATYASAVGSNDASATLLINNNNFKMYNMNSGCFQSRVLLVCPFPDLSILLSSALARIKISAI